MAGSPVKRDRWRLSIDASVARTVGTLTLATSVPEIDCVFADEPNTGVAPRATFRHRGQSRSRGKDGAIVKKFVVQRVRCRQPEVCLQVQHPG